MKEECSNTKCNLNYLCKCVKRGYFFLEVQCTLDERGDPLINVQCVWFKYLNEEFSWR